MIVLLVFVAFALYIMTAEERRRLPHVVEAAIRHPLERVLRFRADIGAFGGALRERTPWLVVTPALAAVNLAVVGGMLIGDGLLGDPATLVTWGGSFAPRTTNGEWWRLVTSMFVHGGMVPLVINTVALVQLGLVLERLTGHAAFAASYVCAGFAAALMDLSITPDAVTAGSSGAVFGVHGVLAAVLLRGCLRPSPFSIPLATGARLMPVVAVFTIYHVAIDGFGLAARAGLFTGFVVGTLVTKGLADRKPALPRLAGVTAATCVIVAIAALPLKGVTDVRPEIQLLVALEERTAAAYDAAVDGFRTGRVAAKSLTELIEGKIRPEIDAARDRWTALKRVPAAHAPLLLAANDYLRLRDESWRLRAEALARSNMGLLREADRTERESLAAFDRIKRAVDQ